MRDVGCRVVERFEEIRSVIGLGGAMFLSSRKPRLGRNIARLALPGIAIHFMKLHEPATHQNKKPEAALAAPG